MSSQIVPEIVWRSHAKDILDVLSINDSGLLDDPHEFWKRVALSIKLGPKDSQIDNAQACIERLGGNWDDEYFLDGDLASDVVYGEFAALLTNLPIIDIQQLQQGDFQLPLEDDEEVIDERIIHTTIQRTVGDLIGEIIGGAIKLDPEYQRQFVWPTKKSQKYIESILLDVPTPSILLYQQGGGPLGMGGVFFVVDGRQRLETLLRFVATAEELKTQGFHAKRFKTPKGADDFKNFQTGGSLEGFESLFFKDLPDEIQKGFKGRYIPVTYIKDVQKKTLYHIFSRYNTGSEKLNPAEIRNAVYQDAKIHKTLWTLARESDTSSAADPAELSAIEQLKLAMGKKKRYGTYDFIGRVMAFTYLTVGPSDAKPSANNATKKFYDDFEILHGDHDKLRTDFVKTYYKVVDWYDDELLFVRPGLKNSVESSGRFHAWAATIQMATAHHLRLQVEEGKLNEAKIIEYIKSDWCRFAGIDPIDLRTYGDDDVGGEMQPAPGLFQLRQNAANFWRYQEEWLRGVEAASKIGGA